MWTRRDWLRMAARGFVLLGFGWIEALAADTRRHPERKRSCILLWMPGGPSQLDTFDPKPGHANGGPFKAIATSAPGVRISEHLPKLAKQMDRAAVDPLDVHQGGDHNRATIADADRLSAAGADSLSELRLALLEGADGAGFRDARLREHRALQLLRDRARLPRPTISRRWSWGMAAIRPSPKSTMRTHARRTSRFRTAAEGRKSRFAGRRHHDARRGAARPVEGPRPRFPRAAAGRPRDQSPVGL